MSPNKINIRRIEMARQKESILIKEFRKEIACLSEGSKKDFMESFTGLMNKIQKQKQIDNADDYVKDIPTETLEAIINKRKNPPAENPEVKPQVRSKRSATKSE